MALARRPRPLALRAHHDPGVRPHRTRPGQRHQPGAVLVRPPGACPGSDGELQRFHPARDAAGYVVGVVEDVFEGVVVDAVVNETEPFGSARADGFIRNGVGQRRNLKGLFDPAA